MRAHPHPPRFAPRNRIKRTFIPAARTNRHSLRLARFVPAGMVLSSYFLTDFPSNCICSFMVWVRCRRSAAQAPTHDHRNKSWKGGSPGGGRVGARLPLPLHTARQNPGTVDSLLRFSRFQEPGGVWRGRGRARHPPPTPLGSQSPTSSDMQ